MLMTAFYRRTSKMLPVEYDYDYYNWLWLSTCIDSSRRGTDRHSDQWTFVFNKLWKRSEILTRVWTELSCASTSIWKRGVSSKNWEHLSYEMMWQQTHNNIKRKTTPSSATISRKRSLSLRVHWPVPAEILPDSDLATIRIMRHIVIRNQTQSPLPFSRSPERRSVSAAAAAINY